MESSAEQNEQLAQNDFEKWSRFLAKYCGCCLDPDTEGYNAEQQKWTALSESDKEKFDKPENIYKNCFELINKVEEFKVKFADESDFKYNCNYGHLHYVCTKIKNRHKHDNGYWRYFPNSIITAYIFGFFSVISWVGMGYFANALRSATEGEPKFNVFINSLAGIFDTAACGFILYSLIIGAPMFSIPMIIAAAVSVLLRVIFTVFIFNNIYENKKSIAENVNMDQTLREIEKYLEQHKPEEVEEPDDKVEEKPKEKGKINEKGEEKKEDDIDK